MYYNRRLIGYVATYSVCMGEGGSRYRLYTVKVAIYDNHIYYSALYPR